jgi:hypothetical protein
MRDTPKDAGHKRKLQNKAAVNAESWPSHDEPIADLWKWLG